MRKKYKNFTIEYGKSACYIEFNVWHIRLENPTTDLEMRLNIRQNRRIAVTLLDPQRCIPFVVVL